MSTLNDKTFKKLNEILMYLHDSHKGYLECADKINNQTLKALLIQAAAKRQEMIQSIEYKIKNLAHDDVALKERGSIAGPAHRLYIDLKSALTNGDEDAILNEIKRGENTLINSYKETLRTPIPSDLNRLLKNELAQIQDTVKQLDQASI